jgi:hypothetical protein
MSFSTVSGNEIPDLPTPNFSGESVGTGGSSGCFLFLHAEVCDLHTGGGLYNAGTANLVNTTFSGNSVGEGFGAAVDTTSGTMTAIFVTIADNSQTTPTDWVPVDALPGYPRQGSTVVGAVRMAGTVIDGGAPLCSASSSASSLGYNVAADDSCFTATPNPTDRSSTASGLGPLADNGGATLTHLPAPGSVLIDSIPAGALPCGSVVQVDQRDAPRPTGAACTPGAVEP